MSNPELPISPELRFDPDASVQWVLLLYGATMLAVQGFEFSLRWLYAVVNVDPNKVSNASIERQWRKAFEKMWSAFQKGSAGMRLADENKGLKGQIPDDLFDELDDFIQRRRNPLAHNFLVERISAEEGGRFASGTILFLVESTIAASKLNDRMQAVADEIRSTWPEQPKPPDEVLKFMETLGRVTMLKQFPQDFVERASGADAPDG
jgi:hypothetical protein